MTLMIIDGNSLVYAAQSATPLTVDGMEVQGIYNSLRTLRTLLYRYPHYAAKVIWLWDHRAQWRYDLYPDYKGKRRDTLEKISVKESLEAAKPMLEEMLQSLGVDQMFATGYEADDVAAMLSRAATSKQRDTLLITGDRDWLQLVNRYVSWVDARAKDERHVRRANFQEYTGVMNPRQLIEVKALVGDVSDNIKGVGGIGEKTALGIMDHFGGIQELRAQLDKPGYSKADLPESLQRAWKPLQALFADNWERYQTNRLLMDLTDPSRDKDIFSHATVIKGAYCPDTFGKQCENLNFYSILRDLGTWLEPLRPNASRRVA